MKASFLFLLFSFYFLIPVKAQEKAASPDSASVNKTDSAAADRAAIEKDGSSYDKAIVIKEDHESQGIHAEYAWIRNKYPGSKTRSQSLNFHDKKPFDIIHITTSDGKEVAVYFDISNFYGKF
jgi:hypothetical protein